MKFGSWFVYYNFICTDEVFVIMVVFYNFICTDKVSCIKDGFNFITRFCDCVSINYVTFYVVLCWVRINVGNDISSFIRTKLNAVLGEGGAGYRGDSGCNMDG